MLIIRKLSFISVNLKMAPCGTTSGNYRICLNHYVSLLHRIYVARKEKMSGSFISSLQKNKVLSDCFQICIQQI